MVSTYTSNTGVEKPATGEQSGTWGDTVNLNMDILDRALNGVGTITLSGTTHTLTTTDGTLSDGMYGLLVLGGSPSGTNTITIAPNDAQKVYLVVNASGEDAIFTQGSGSNVTVPNGASKIIYADGAGASAAVSDFTDTLAITSGPISGSALSGGTITSPTISGGTITGITDLAVADGGTGASDAAGARSNLGLGTIATQAASNVAITGGSVTGITDLAVADGGTGASDAATALSNLGGEPANPDILKADTSDVVTAKYTETPITDSSSGNVITLNFSTRSTTEVDLSENITTVTISGMVAGDKCEAWFKQAAGNYTVSGWFHASATIKWMTQNKTPPTMPSGADQYMVVQFRMTEDADYILASVGTTA